MPECVRRRQKVPENARKYQKVSESARKCQKVPESAEKCQKVPNGTAVGEFTKYIMMIISYYSIKFADQNILDLFNYFT